MQKRKTTFANYQSMGSDRQICCVHGEKQKKHLEKRPILFSFACILLLAGLSLGLISCGGGSNGATQNTTSVRGFQILGPFTFTNVQFSGTATTQEVETAAIEKMKQITFTYTSQGLFVRDDYGTRYAKVSSGSDNSSQISYSFINLSSNVFFTGTLSNWMMHDAIYQWGGSGGVVVNGGNYGYATSATVQFSSPVQTFY